MSSLTPIETIFDYIDSSLSEDLNLETIAQEADYSPFHFHRVFKYITGETLSNYITRKRVEKATLDLLHSEASITEIALINGFNSSSNFTRVFKKYYQIAPLSFRKQHTARYEKIKPLLSKIGKEYPSRESYTQTIQLIKNWIFMNSTIEVKHISPIQIAYIDFIGMQNIGPTYAQIMQWAASNNLLDDQTKMITQYHDSLKVTSPEKLRLTASILLSEAVNTDSKLPSKEIESGKYIIGHFELKQQEFEKAWTGLFMWMNENGYKKNDLPPFALYHNDFRKHPQQLSIVDLYIPINL